MILINIELTVLFLSVDSLEMGKHCGWGGQTVGRTLHLVTTHDSDLTTVS